MNMDMDMDMNMDSIEKTLFFKDTGCRAKYKPQTRKNATNFTEAFSNMGAGLRNMVFFDDLKTVASQGGSSDDGSSTNSDDDDLSPKSARRTNAPKMMMKTYGDMGDDAMTMAFSEENTVQVRSRKMTIPPPALRRFKKTGMRS